MFCNRIWVVIGLLVSSNLGWSQQVKNKYNWQYLGPSSIPPSNADSLQWTSTGTGWIEDILITDKYWYAGSITGGLYCSKNDGKTWAKIDNDTPIQLGTLCLAKVGETLFRGSGLTHYDEDFGFGLYQSTNGGKKWCPTGLQFEAKDKKPLWAIGASPFDSTLLACTPNSIYYSADFGKTWNECFLAKKIDFRTVVFSKHTRELVFASGNRLLKSENNGLEWQDITEFLSVYDEKIASKMSPNIERIAFCEDPNSKGRYLAFYSTNNKTYVDESIDEGLSWSNLHTSVSIRRIDIHHAEIKVAPGNSAIILLGGVRAYLSKDGGQSFEQVTFPFYQDRRFAHDDIRGIEMLSANEFFLATDGGVFRTIDTGKVWQNVSGKGLNTMQIYGLGLFKSGEIMLGCQDLGTFKVKDKKWLNIGTLYGDGGDAIDVKNDYLTFSGGAIRKMEKSNLRSTLYVHPPANINPFTAKLVNYPGIASDSFFYVGKDLWMNNGQRWFNLSASLQTGQFKITGFDICQLNPMQLFIGVDQPTWNPQNIKNKLFKSENGGEDWEDLSKNLPILAWRHITCITTNPRNENEVFAGLGTLDEAEIHKVYKSTDGGETWTNYSEGLDKFETFKIYHFKNGSGLLLATLNGLYYRNNGMDSWQKLKGKIPYIAIRDFEVDEENRLIYAGTYGNGLWQMKIPKKMMMY